MRVRKKKGRKTKGGRDGNYFGYLFWLCGVDAQSVAKVSLKA